MPVHFKRILLYFFLIILPELSTAISVDSLSACSESLRASVISQARYTAEDQFLPVSSYAVTKRVSGYEDLDKANDVPQFNEDVRKAFLVYADSGKLFYRDGTPVHISNEELRTQLKLFADFNGGKVDDEMAEDIGLIYVMDKLGQIYIQRFDILNPDWDLYHSSFLAGGPVAAAGMIVVQRGGSLESMITAVITGPRPNTFINCSLSYEEWEWISTLNKFSRLQIRLALAKMRARFFWKLQTLMPLEV